MEENNTNVEVNTNGGDGAGATTNTDTNTSDTVTMSKADYDKAIQSAEDKVRGKLSKEIKDLQAKVKELTPVEKSPEQLALEERIAKLEESEKALADKERRLSIQESLAAKNIDKTLVDFIKDDADLDGLTAVLENMIKERMKTNGYVPKDHVSDDSITLEEWKKMSYSEKAKIMSEKPDLYKRLTAKN